MTAPADQPDLTVIAHDLHDAAFRVAALVQKLVTPDPEMTPAQRATLKRKIAAAAKMTRGQTVRMMKAVGQ
jgi:hypothetical protein